MPDSAVTLTRTETAAALAALPASIRANRRPALPGFLARAILKIDWLDGIPDEWSLRWVLETCKAELEWSIADWRRLAGAIGCDVECTVGQHPSEVYRLPHEAAAARVLNCWSHLHPTVTAIAVLKDRSAAQLDAATDTRQSNAYRESWANRLPGTIDDLRWHEGELPKQQKAFDDAVAAYKAARGAITMKEAA